MDQEGYLLHGTCNAKRKMCAVRYRFGLIIGYVVSETCRYGQMQLDFLLHGTDNSTLELNI